MTPPVYRDGLGNVWDADGRLIEKASGPYAAHGDLWPPADDVRLAAAQAVLRDTAPMVQRVRLAGVGSVVLPATDVIQLHDALSYTVARASEGCDSPGVLAFLLTVLLGVAGGVVLAALLMARVVCP